MVRGQLKEFKTLKISGNIFLAYIDEEANFTSGDIMLYPDYELEHINPEFAVHMRGYRGCVKLKIFDNYKWCHLDKEDFFNGKENNFSKTEIALDVMNLCRDMLVDVKDIIVYRTYREHYTTDEPKIGVYKGKRSQK